MNKVARFLFTGFVLCVIVVILSVALAQTSAKKAAKQNAQNVVRIVLAR